ncbi:hypothetical protein GCM10010302_32500 [Streptomyces polychromogenes]|uniref:Uncharacterized protein n=1 Tax=Streptomyces polychromogenes TaxID=67342 RepID=A0ABN0VDV0_9ACTN
MGHPQTGQPRTPEPRHEQKIAELVHARWQPLIRARRRAAAEEGGVVVHRARAEPLPELFVLVRVFHRHLVAVTSGAIWKRGLRRGGESAGDSRAAMGDVSWTQAGRPPTTG